MAQITNTFETYDAVGNRETLADRIYMTTPQETPFLSLVGKKNIDGVHPEWQTDELATPSTSNNRPEGNDWSYDAVTPTTRVGTYAQISDKTVIISQTQEAVSKAGRDSELGREVMKKGIELRTDMEVIALSNQASSAGSGNGASNRTTGGLRAWLASNDSMGSGGSSGGFSGGLVTAATNGTQRAFTKAILDAVILSTHNNGGSPDTLIVSPYVKTVFSTFMSDSNVAQQRYMAKKDNNAIIASAEVYMSDFGEITVVPNRQMARLGAASARNAFLVDAKQAKIGVLRDIKLEKPAKTGDAEKRVLVTEWALIVNNEKAHGAACDLYGMSASS